MSHGNGKKAPLDASNTNKINSRIQMTFLPHKPSDKDVTSGSDFHLNIDEKTLQIRPYGQSQRQFISTS
jgi:hypothetical protein